MIDLLLLIVMIWYVFSGYRQGLVVGVLSLGGFLGGALLAMLVVPAATQRLDDRVAAVVHRAGRGVAAGLARAAARGPGRRQGT